MPDARHDEWQGLRRQRAWIFPPMDRCLAPPVADVVEQGGEGCGPQPDPPNPFLTLFDAALAQACRARADALESLSWATQAERMALRAGTALLLDAVAHRLAKREPASAERAVPARFRLEDLLDESQHAPYLAAYERDREQAGGQEPFGAPR